MDMRHNFVILKRIKQNKNKIKKSKFKKLNANFAKKIMSLLLFDKLSF